MGYINKCDFVIGYDEIGVIHHIPSKRIVKCTRELAKKIKEGLEENPINNEVENYLVKNFGISSQSGKKELKRLELVVTTCCNLNCVYCYANGGNYGMKEVIMNQETVDGVIQYIMDNYSGVEEVVFFGGEPLLGYKTIMYFCDKLASYCSQKVEYKMVSNFTFLPDEFIEYIINYNISITVSLDGPKEINDILRVPKYGQESTFDLVEHNINRMKKNGTDITCFECTYTSKHLENGYSKEKIISYFEEKWGNYGLLLCDEHSYVKAQKNQEKNDYNELYDITQKRLLRGWYSEDIGYHFCMAGKDMFSVYPDGTVFPCHGFEGKSDWIMGNVFDTQWERREKCIVVRKRLEAIRDTSMCNSCTARECCVNCLAEIIKDWGGILQKSCEWKRLRLEQVLLEFCRNR